MKTSAPSLASSTDSGTRLCEGLEIIGEVKFTDAMRVETKISGKVFSDSGTLVVGEKGHVQATIEAGFVEIFGTVEGSVTAKHGVQIHAGAERRARGVLRGEVSSDCLSDFHPPLRRSADGDLEDRAFALRARREEFDHIVVIKGQP